MSVAGYVENALRHIFALSRSKPGMTLVLANQRNAMNFRAASIVSGAWPSQIINPDFFFAQKSSPYEVVKWSWLVAQFASITKRLKSTSKYTLNAKKKTACLCIPIVSEMQQLRNLSLRILSTIQKGLPLRSRSATRWRSQSLPVGFEIGGVLRSTLRREPQTSNSTPVYHSNYTTLPHPVLTPSILLRLAITW